MQVENSIRNGDAVINDVTISIHYEQRNGRIAPFNGNNIKTGERIEVYWPLDDSSYPGTVEYIQNSHYQIMYDYGDREPIRLIEKD